MKMADDDRYVCFLGFVEGETMPRDVYVRKADVLEAFGKELASLYERFESLETFVHQ